MNLSKHLSHAITQARAATQPLPTAIVQMIWEAVNLADFFVCFCCEQAFSLRTDRPHCPSELR